MALQLCDGPDEALVALVVKQFREHVSGFLGRTAIQKLCYFSRELGVPFSYRFSIYHYGPYSDHLATAIDYMIAEHVLTDQSPDRQRYSNFALGPNAEELLSRHKDTVRQSELLIRSVAQAFGDFSPETLELMATVYFVHERLRATGVTPAEDEVIQEFLQEKASKFELDEICDAYRGLKDAGFFV
jgi:uncharacterized protein YwgA